MFLIFGFGHHSKKSYGYEKDHYCDKCYRDEERQIIRVTTWITLFFIPVLPVVRNYYLVCTGCGTPEQISKDEFRELIMKKEKVSFDINKEQQETDEENYDDSSGRYQTSVQRNYWKEMKAFDEDTKN